jgi:rsbT co-antagonist protein RsbR
MSGGERDSDRVGVEVAGMRVEWDIEKGESTWAGVPAASFFVPSSLAALMSGFQKMVGVERFNLALQAEGRNSVDDDWRLISTAPSFEEGFDSHGRGAAAAGWGRWRLVSLDRDRSEACIRVVNNWEGLYQKALGVCWGSSFIGGKLAGLCSKLFGTNCWAKQVAFVAKGDAYDEFLIAPSEMTVEKEIESLLESDHATRADLAVALQKLRQEVAERAALHEDLTARTKTEQELREKLDLIERQEQAIRAMSTPIIQVWDGVLTLPVVGTVTAARATDMMTSLLDTINRTGSRFAILDVTGVEDVDSSTADHLLQIMRAVELMGAKAIITGIRPAVAQTVTSLGVDLAGIVTLSNLQEGLKLCMRWLDKTG